MKTKIAQISKRCSGLQSLGIPLILLTLAIWAVKLKADITWPDVTTITWHGISDRPVYVDLIGIMLGVRVAVLSDGEIEPSQHNVVFDAVNLSSGSYLLKVRSGELSATQKLVLLR